MQVDNLTYNANDIRNDVPELSDKAEELIELLKESRYIFEQLFVLEIDFDLSEDEEREIMTQVNFISPVVNYARIVQLVFQLTYYKLIFKKVLSKNLNIPLTKQINACITKIEQYLVILEDHYFSR
ncbi:MAG: hypothetical protein K9W45_09600 [Candidatus Heimdallarchaeum aukensis]|uniref:Uncharacterized protein n=1 Tax=Candidatus Heimdallarchaeum aukensis TaxID=2876573 RepID=A0A9Y1BJ90_9ARCH|nr:MAG: hypothetical protein K9W45_09600 [Candidatus Heimdallarchaeum aukensis]